MEAQHGGLADAAIKVSLERWIGVHNCAFKSTTVLPCLSLDVCQVTRLWLHSGAQPMQVGTLCDAWEVLILTSLTLWCAEKSIFPQAALNDQNRWVWKVSLSTPLLCECKYYLTITLTRPYNFKHIVIRFIFVTSVKLRYCLLLRYKKILISVAIIYIFGWNALMQCILAFLDFMNRLGRIMYRGMLAFHYMHDGRPPFESSGLVDLSNNTWSTIIGIVRTKDLNNFADNEGFAQCWP